MGHRVDRRTGFLLTLGACWAVWLSACGDPIGNPDPFMFPDAIDFRGEYSVNHLFSVPGTARSSGCTGDALLSSDLGLGFSGTIGIDASGPCAVLTGDVGQIVGAVSGQTISFSVEGLADPLAAIGCSITGGLRHFDGTYTTRQVVDVTRVQTLRGTREVNATCEGLAGEVPARWEIRATRR